MCCGVWLWRPGVSTKPHGVAQPDYRRFFCCSSKVGLLFCIALWSIMVPVKIAVSAAAWSGSFGLLSFAEDFSVLLFGASLAAVSVLAPCSIFLVFFAFLALRTKKPSYMQVAIICFIISEFAQFATGILWCYASGAVNFKIPYPLSLIFGSLVAVTIFTTAINTIIGIVYWFAIQSYYNYLRDRQLAFEVKGANRIGFLLEYHQDFLTPDDNGRKNSDYR